MAGPLATRLPAGIKPQPTPTATTAPTPTATPIPEPASIAGFTAFLAEAEAGRTADRQYLVNRYVAALPAAPITERQQAIFVWQGAVQQVQLVGDMNGWDPERAPEMIPLRGSDLWYLPAEFPGDARLDYKFLVDGADWRLDRLNPRQAPSGFGPNSEVAMPGYETPPEVGAVLGPPLGGSNTVPAGRLTTHTLDSASLGQTRTIYVYSPPAQLVGEKLPSVYIHDGSDYLNLIDTPALLDQLVAARAIPPLVAVFIPPIQREAEYNRHDGYVNFLADELVPFIRQTYDTDPSPAKTGTLGASMGGLIAVYAAATRPETFGLAAGQSGAYSLDSDAVIHLLRNAPTRPVRFYLVVGTYETAVGGSAVGNLLAANQRLVQVLRDNGYDFSYEELPQGHSWGLWRDTLGRALGFLY